MSSHISHWIGGRPVAGPGGRTAPVHNPTTGERIAETVLATEADVETAVADSVRAADGWRRASLSKRAAVLFAFREQLHSHIDELAAAVATEHGKTLADAAGEVRRGLENIEFATGVPHLLKGEHSTEAAGGIDVHSVREPLGVVVGITPFNFPAMVPLWMCGNAIAAGNAFLLKPSEKVPSAALLLARLWQRAGLPDGVFNVLQGDAGTVDALLRHPDVAAVSFVGSTPVARHVHRTATEHGKRVQALGGAKNHAVVLPDADLDVAADAIVSAAYGSAGERCMALSVAVAVGGVGDALVARIADRLPGVRLGVDMGPLITREHRDRVAGYVAAGAEQGATVLVDGRDAEPPAPGFFLGASLLDHVTPEMSAYRDEIFGPVLSVVRVPGFEEAVELVNANPYGNGTAVFTRDGGAARRFVGEIQVGMVGVNVPVPVPVGAYSFGGWKASLFGDAHMYGPEGLAFYTRAKVVTTRWPDPATSAVDLGFPQTR
ncbi:CoA-acylating methylmalonate-semialdehyde dehydrogenase [Streptomyces sp. DSM 44915]|uniref:methylmalonate-semialdehyde dehydrogenase (CoA acylating) n=1 Tax=Streptomyces chisholmiae TaxID=3075540 RepID=A0ABU2JVR8_9ACTN|nr:CoA-acylating methylmalonate-semialdehyde dehydrogenase [Streptomyces sp. DSM 44915]MDT0268851.1 CoA-acylating methylmalonate-semialdehyde dehydrogenase [Streptomyces sp. DSM 44915]